MRYPDHLLKLIDVLKKLPGIGIKSAERFAFHLLDWPENKLNEMGQVIRDIKKNLTFCPECGSLKGHEPCRFCDLNRRNQELLCIVASPKIIFSIEETSEYRGLYHVIGELLSPIHQKAPDSKRIDKLKTRIQSLGIKEVIIALDSTLEGDATALYLKRELSTLGVKTTRLALGLPLGSPLDFIDGGTLARALIDRGSY